MIAVSPLALLGDHHADDLREVGTRAIGVDIDTIGEAPQTFEVKTFITISCLTLRIGRTSSMGHIAL
jgi:hypothetical protein